MQYTDWAIGDFLRRARASDWYANTVFVVVADHCASSAGRTDLPVSDFRIPLLVHAPGRVAPGRVDTLASQLDVAPTLLALLRFEYASRFFGRDILATPRGTERALIATYERLGLLSRDFLMLVLIAIAVSLPLAWWAMERWLGAFAYRIAIGWEVPVMAALGCGWWFVRNWWLYGEIVPLNRMAEVLPTMRRAEPYTWQRTFEHVPWLIASFWGVFVAVIAPAFYLDATRWFMLIGFVGLLFGLLLAVVYLDRTHTRPSLRGLIVYLVLLPWLAVLLSELSVPAFLSLALGHAHAPSVADSGQTSFPPPDGGGKRRRRRQLPAPETSRQLPTNVIPMRAGKCSEIVATLEAAGRAMTVGELAQAMRVTPGEASRRWREAGKQVTSHRDGKFVVIGLPAWGLRSVS